MQIIQNRRSFLTGLSAIGAVGLIGNDKLLAASEPAPETTVIRLPAIPGACVAPLYVAEELLHEEGFTEVQYVPTTIVSAGMLADGKVDFSMEAPVDYLHLLDTGSSMTVLAGIHTGCMELRVNDSIKSVADLRGKKVGINTVGDAGQLLVGAMAAYVGLDPVNEIEWIVNPTASQPDLFTNGEIDAFIGFPPDPTQPCALDAGHVIVNIGSDAPWSRYFCCMATANADFVRNNPVATKRALRAILKATDICHEQPDVAVQRVVEKIGFSHECAHMHLHHADYSHWRDYDPEDAVRFYALRLQEVGMIKKSPNEIISNFTDWRFLEEIKKELA